MKKIIYTLVFSMGVFAANAQGYKGNVGINTTTPNATLDVKKYLGETGTAFRISRGAGDSNDLFKISDEGYLLSGPNITRKYSLTIKSNGETRPVFAIADKENPKAFFKHYIKYQQGTSNAELDAYKIPAQKVGHFFVFSSGGNNDSGFFIGSVTDQPSGLYVGEDGKNGVGLTEKTTETLDASGNILIAHDTRNTDFNNASNLGTCTKPGEFIYYNGFFACGADNLWKKLDN